LSCLLPPRALGDDDDDNDGDHHRDVDKDNIMIGNVRMASKPMRDGKAMTTQPEYRKVQKNLDQGYQGAKRRRRTHNRENASDAGTHASKGELEEERDLCKPPLAFFTTGRLVLASPTSGRTTACRVYDADESNDDDYDDHIARKRARKGSLSLSARRRSDSLLLLSNAVCGPHRWEAEEGHAAHGYALKSGKICAVSDTGTSWLELGPGPFHHIRFAKDESPYVHIHRSQTNELPTPLALEFKTWADALTFVDWIKSCIQGVKLEEKTR